MHVRLRDNAEPVALCGGIDKEGALIETKFKELLKHRLRLLRTQWNFNMTQVGYKSYEVPIDNLRCAIRHLAVSCNAPWEGLTLRDFIAQC